MFFIGTKIHYFSKIESNIPDSKGLQDCIQDGTFAKTEHW